MLRRFVFVSVVLALNIDATAQVNFSENIAPIIYSHCTKCHREGEIGGFGMTNYEEVSEIGSTILEVTSINFMPPWRPDPDYRHFLNENVLTQNEKDMIAE